MSSAIETLEKLVLKDGKCVTKALFMRQSLFSTQEVKNAMNELYEKRKDLSAVFLVYGIKKDKVHYSVMCSKDLLEKAKEGFIEIISITIYSLHQTSSTKVYDLLNTDWSGKYEEAKASYNNRIPIVSPLAIQAIKTWKKRNPKPVYSAFEVPKFAPKIKRTSNDWLRNIVVKSDQHSLEAAFENGQSNSKMEVDEEEASTSKQHDEACLLNFLMEVDHADSSSKKRLHADEPSSKPKQSKKEPGKAEKEVAPKKKSLDQNSLKDAFASSANNNKSKVKTEVEKWPSTSSKHAESSSKPKKEPIKVVPKKKTKPLPANQTSLTSFFKID